MAGTVRTVASGILKPDLLDWQDVIDRTALGFDQLKPPGLAEITAIDATGSPIAAADANTNADRAVELPCGQGPVLAVSGRFVQTSVSTTVAALLSGDPIPARPCDPVPISLPAGSQELLISPGPAFIADGVDLDGPLSARLTPAPTTGADVGRWTADRREVTVERSPVTRVLAVPESVNPGWSASTAGGVALTPVIVNGWQQGWVLPPGTQGQVTLSFAANAAYRASLLAGLCLLPLLVLLARWRRARRVDEDPPPRPWAPRLTAPVAAIAAATMIAGAAGAVVSAAALLTGWLLRQRQPLAGRLTLVTVPAGLILAGSLLSRYPWRSVDGYIGDSGWVQFPALVSVAVLLAASAITAARSE